MCSGRLGIVCFSGERLGLIMTILAGILRVRSDEFNGFTFLNAIFMCPVLMHYRSHRVLP
jgi:hypothetical protein